MRTARDAVAALVPLVVGSNNNGTSASRSNRAVTPAAVAAGVAVAGTVSVSTSVPVVVGAAGAAGPDGGVDVAEAVASSWAKWWSTAARHSITCRRTRGEVRRVRFTSTGSSAAS